MTAMIPTLKTDRLILRPFALSDFDTYADFVTSDRTEFMGGPYDRDTAWNWFCNDTGHWQLFGFGGLMITTHDGDLVGQVSVTQGISFPEPEIGWFLFDGHEGKGYAGEAAQCLRDFVVREQRVTSLVSYVAPGNAASAKLAERMGARLDDTAARPADNPLVYRHPVTGGAA